MTTWKILERRVKKYDQPMVTVRRDGLAINKKASEFLGLDGGVYYATIFVSECGRKVGMSFSKNDSIGAYKVKGDGGNKMGQVCSYHIACGCALFAEVPRLERGYKAEMHRDESSKVYYFNVGLAFDLKASQRKPESGEIGVYRYIFDDEIVYIGHGFIQSRLSSKDRADWEFDDVEYVVIGDKSESEAFESECLESYRDKNGRLPIYNRIMGRKNAS